MKKDLNSISWQEFVVEDLFFVKIGKNINANKINKRKGKTAYITRKESNNGLDGFVNHHEELLNTNFPIITIGNETAVPFVQNYPFFTGTKVNILQPKTTVSKHALLFVTQCLKMHKNKYSYSYTINSTRLRKQKILLPAREGQPDYSFMAGFMKDKETAVIHQYKNHIQDRLDQSHNKSDVLALTEKNWKAFALPEIFPKIQRGKRLKKGNHTKGKTPYISSTAFHNGVDNFVGNKDKVRIFADCLTIANSGSVGVCFYQPFQFVASDHITQLKNDNFNKYTYLFLSALISRIAEKYSFNREINDTRIRSEKILLPVNNDQQPDYEYMENYMRKKEHEKIKAFLNMKGIVL